MNSDLVREFADGELVPGTRYRVLGLIGAGGMGSVYDVEHTELGKRFVLKALLRELSRRKDLVARLRQEWRALARLEHPCIVNVTDAGTSDNGVPFYVMERLDGETLSARLKRELRLPVPEALLVAAGVLDGLSAAHEIGIVHRDVKPPNIIVLPGGGVKLLDFGIAKIASSSAEVITARGVAIGTPRYMSPEQARGERVDGRADLYAAGLILFEMIAGRGPFDGVADANQLLLAHLSHTPRRLASLAEGVPPELDAIVASLLEKDPRARPPSARRVAEALRQLAARLGAVPSARASTPPATRGSTPPRASGPPADRTLPASPRASPQFDATVRLSVPAPDATVPSAPPGDTAMLDPKRTVRLDEMEARRSDPPRAAAAPDATAPALPDWHPDAGKTTPDGEAAPGFLPGGADRTLTLEELGHKSRPVEVPVPTRTAVPVAAAGGETPPPVESSPPPAQATSTYGAGLRLALALALLASLGLLGVGAWAVLGSHGATASADQPSAAPAPSAAPEVEGAAASAAAEPAPAEQKSAEMPPAVAPVAVQPAESAPPPPPKSAARAPAARPTSQVVSHPAPTHHPAASPQQPRAGGMPGSGL